MGACARAFYGEGEIEQLGFRFAVEYLALCLRLITKKGATSDNLWKTFTPSFGFYCFLLNWLEVGFFEVRTTRVC